MTNSLSIQQVGPNWEGVVEKCTRGRYQPLLLLYAVPQPPSGAQMAQFAQEIAQRRAITPSPEKNPIGNTRRAITPTPIRSPVSDYQNLNVIQQKIRQANDETDSYISRKTVENVLNAQYQNLNVIQDKIFDDKKNEARKHHMNLHRSLSAESGSSPPSDGLSIPEHLNQPRRRDSGNWSGDRNSASSASSTTLDNPYLYMVAKRNGPSAVPQSPTHRNGHPYDPGYDSFSLSSTDSYPPKMHNPQLAKIPESVVLTGDCEKLCHEADQLLEKSRMVEESHDLETALVLCNAAAGRARAAMDAPYSNPHTMTFARMKHNTCVMRARSLHRKILVEKGVDADFNLPEIKHIREGSNSSVKHIRQNSKDKTLDTKNIEIYATLPKKKGALKAALDAENAIHALDSPAKERESRSLFTRNKDKDKRSRSEDRNKISSVDTALMNAKDTLKKHKEEKDEKKDKEKSGKKQHKIRRKLLMGGLIRRKNRSMPDLTDANDEIQHKENIPDPPMVTVDDSSVGLAGKDNMSGYISEGHFEYRESNANPNLERSRLMRKSFHGSGRQLTAAKVAPPPPLRISSALTQEAMMKTYHEANLSNISAMSSNTSISEDSCQTIITTCAQVHSEQSPGKPEFAVSADEVDAKFEELPPYPSPPGSANHSRQASEDFPPPPPELEPISHQMNQLHLSELSRRKSLDTLEGTTSILAQLQQRQLMKMRQDPQQSDWLQELQMKQSDIRNNNVKNIASRFEGPIKSYSSQEILNKPELRTTMNGTLPPQHLLISQAALKPIDLDEVDCMMKSKIAQNQIAEEMKEVEMLNRVVQQTFNMAAPPKRQKKKSVSFCDQVTLVATADDDEDDSFIPNPILERVLRNAQNTGETPVTAQQFSQHQQQNIIRLQTEPQPRAQNLAVQSSLQEQQRRNISQEIQRFVQMRQPQMQQIMQTQPQPPYQYPPQVRAHPTQPPIYTPMQDIFRTQNVPGQLNGSSQRPPMNGISSVANNQHLMMQPQQTNNIHPIDSNRIPPNLNQSYLMQRQIAAQQKHYQLQQQQQQLQQQLFMQQQQQQQLPYQRVPMPHGCPVPVPMSMPVDLQPPQQMTYSASPYMQPPIGKPPQKKVSFEPGTKGDNECLPSPQPSTTSSTPSINGNIMLDNNSLSNGNGNGVANMTAIPTRVYNNAIVKASAKAVECNLCRKKHVIAPAVYCTNCEYYLQMLNSRR